VPEFALLEVGNAIRYSARAGESDGAAALDLLRDLSIEIHALSWDLLRKANAISWAYKIAMYDAAYVALAEGVGFPLLTADEGLLKKMKGHSIVLRLRDLVVAERR
jgi:predicted nucleic acid-binding protein